MQGFTTIPAVKQALKDRFAARLAAGQDFAAVQVVRAHPGRQARDELVLVGHTESPERDHAAEAAAIGRRGRDERYFVNVIVDVVDYGNEPEVVEDRAWAIVHELELELRDDPRLGGGVFPDGNGAAAIDSLDDVTRDVESDRMGVGYQTVIVVRVGVQARI